MNHLKFRNHRLGHAVSAPYIFSVIIPIVIADIWIEVYHRICFPLYGLPYIERKKYIRIDRQKLSYLNPLQKIFCMYCGYANGVFAYWVQIAAATEKYWCGIQHKKIKDFIPPEHHKDFVPYGDEQAFNDTYKKHR